MNHVAVFLLYFLGDWCGARWAHACSRNQARVAGSWPLCYHLIHAGAVLFIVSDPWCIIPLAAGGAVGCYFAISHKEKQFRNKYYGLDS